MSTGEQTDDNLGIVGLEVRRYKNLRDIWLPWTDGLSLFGINGAGKTNVLECLALLLGTDQTIGLAKQRLANPNPDDLSIIVRPGGQSLPWAPDSVFKRQVTEEMVAEHQSVFPSLGRVRADAEWWRMIGSRGGTDFTSGLASSELPDTVAAFISDVARYPVVRYSLTHVLHSPGGAVREFARTLLSPRVPDEIVDMADQLPDTFGPLRSHVAASHAHPAGWIPVLELPPTQQAPATVQWLPRARTGDEVNSDLLRAFESVSLPVQRLADALADLPLSSAPHEGDWHWWLHKIGEKYGAAELELTLPGVSITATAADDADFTLEVEGSDGPIELSRTGDQDVLEYFSSGERRWVDEALATVARELTKFGQRAELYADVLDGLDSDVVVAAVLDVAGGVEDSIRVKGYWSEEAFDRLLQALEPALVAAARAQVKPEVDVLVREMMRQLRPELLALQPSLVIRVFDEPEAHLHVMAQHAAASAISRLRTRGENVVIASHSPHFLDLPDWSQVHVQRHDARVRLEPIALDSNHARSSLAAQLGINRGELLAGINGVLLVEGKHDQIVLQRLFGSQLHAAGLAVVRMHGTNNLMATAELDFLDQYLDVPIVVLLDYVRVEHVLSGPRTTDEEEKLFHLRRSLKRRNRTYEMVGLERPDIVCYLSESALREKYPQFPGWTTVLREFKNRHSRPKFKQWLDERFGVDLTHSGHIEEMLDLMHDRGHRPVGELARKVSEILSHASGPRSTPQQRDSNH